MNKLLMIPGTLCDDLLFSHQIKVLQGIVKPKVVSNHSSNVLSEIAADILSQNTGNFSLLGLSYGGIIAFELWRQAPERISSLILIDTTHKLPTDETRNNFRKFIYLTEKGRFQDIASDYLMEIMLHPESYKNAKIRQTVLQMSLNVGEDNFLKQVEAQLGRSDSTNDLPNVSCPTLIIVGQEDVVCPLDIHKEISDLIPNSKLEVIPRCGHLSTLEQPDSVNRILKEWFAKPFV